MLRTLTSLLSEREKKSLPTLVAMSDKLQFVARLRQAKACRTSNCIAPGTDTFCL